MNRLWPLCTSVVMACASNTSFVVVTYPDDDGDGCTTDVDCNDHDPSVHPGATDRANDNLDNDCDGVQATVAYPAIEVFYDFPEQFSCAVIDQTDGPELLVVLDENGYGVSSGLVDGTLPESVVANVATQAGDQVSYNVDPDNLGLSKLSRTVIPSGLTKVGSVLYSR